MPGRQTHADPYIVGIGIEFRQANRELAQRLKGVPFSFAHSIQHLTNLLLRHPMTEQIRHAANEDASGITQLKRLIQVVRTPIVMLETVIVGARKALGDGLGITFCYRTIGHLPGATMKAAAGGIPCIAGQRLTIVARDTRPLYAFGGFCLFIWTPLL